MEMFVPFSKKIVFPETLVNFLSQLGSVVISLF